MEQLELRRLLSTATFTADSTSVNSAAAAIFFTPELTPQFVDVRYGSKTGTIVHTFTGTADTDQVISPSAGVVFYRLVPAAAEPDGGITVSAGSGGTLEIDAGAADQFIDLTASTSTSGTVQVADTTNLNSASDVTSTDSYGSGISKLTIRTNDNIGSTYPDRTRGTELATDGSYVFIPNLASATTLDIETGASTYDQITIGTADGGTVSNTTVHTGAGHDALLVTANDGSDADGTMTVSADFGPGTGITNGLGLGNTLNIGAGGTVHLIQAGTTPHLFLDSAEVIEGGTLEVDVQSTIGSVAISSGSAAQINAASTAITTLANDGNAVVTASSSVISHITGGGTTEYTGTAGSATVGDFDAASGILKVDSGATVTVTTATVGSPGGSVLGTLTGSGTTIFSATSGQSTIGTIDAAAGTVGVESGATITVNNTSTVGTFTIGGTVNIAGSAHLMVNTVTTINDGGTLKLLTGTSTTFVDPDNLNVLVMGTTSAHLDLANNAISLNRLAAVDPATVLQVAYGYLVSGYNSPNPGVAFGDWNGAGITSSIVKADIAARTTTNYLGLAIGAWDSTDAGLATGQPSETVLLGMTVLGDANGDRYTDNSDYPLWHNNFGTGDHWAQGDFNYDQFTDNSDYPFWLDNFGNSVP